MNALLAAGAVAAVAAIGAARARVRRRRPRFPVTSLGLRYATEDELLEDAQLVERFPVADLDGECWLGTMNERGGVTWTRRGYR